MHVRFMKGAAGADDCVECVRPDGSSTQLTLPRDSGLPRLAIHFVVESSLRWRDAFFGMVENGESLAAVEQKLEPRARAWTKMPQALQAAALVDCLQTELWSGAADPLEFAQNLIAASRRRGVPPPDVNAEEVARLRVALRQFGAAWRPLAPGGALERTF